MIHWKSNRIRYSSRKTRRSGSEQRNLASKALVAIQDDWQLVVDCGGFEANYPRGKEKRRFWS